MNEIIPVILRKFGAQFATSLRNAPLANAPFSGFLNMVVLDLPLLALNQPVMFLDPPLCSSLEFRLFLQFYLLVVDLHM